MPDVGWYGLVLVIAAGSTAALTVPAKRILPARRLRGSSGPALGARPADPLRRRRGDVRRVPRRGAGRGRHASPAAAVRGLARDDGCRPRGRGDVRRRPDRRRPGHVGAGQDGRPGPRRQHPVLLRRDDVRAQDPARRILRVDARHHPAHHGRVGDRPDQRREPDRRARRPGGGRRRHRRGRVGPLRSPPGGPGSAPERQHRATGGRDRVWHLPRLPALQLQPRRASSWATPARTSWAS